MTSPHYLGGGKALLGFRSEIAKQNQSQIESRKGGSTWKVLAGHMADVPEWLRWARQHREMKGPPKHSGRAARGGQAEGVATEKVRLSLGQLQAGARTLIRPQLFPPLLAPPPARLQEPASPKATHSRQEEAPGEDGIVHPTPFMRTRA